VVIPPALEVRRLTVELDGSPVLCGVELTVEPGAFLSVIGPNGAGKSTLIRSLAGLVSTASGEILVQGTSLAGYSRRALARVVSYVPQADARELPFLVRSFVEMGRYPHLGSWATLGPRDHEAVEVALERTDTAHLAGRSMASLSGGERQRVLIAAALAQGGRILLLDEPTTFLDYRHQTGILRLLESLNADQGLTVVTVTHDLNWTVAVSHSVLALREGRVLFHGPSAEVFREDRLEAIYDNRFELIESGARSIPLVLPARHGT
jgi:iron complex transport system ATP-binding protein